MLSMFHYSEFLAIAITNPRTLSIRSFVLDNGWEYKVAAISCWTEFAIEWYLFPGKLCNVCGYLLIQIQLAKENNDCMFWISILHRSQITVVFKCHWVYYVCVW